MLREELNKVLLQQFWKINRTENIFLIKTENRQKLHLENYPEEVKKIEIKGEKVMAEGVRFELTDEDHSSLVFKTSALNRSAILP